MNTTELAGELRALAAVALACCCLLPLTACAPRGPATFDVSGRVTWEGKPVPAGTVTFSPDVRRGNSGSQGYAAIRDGRYTTRAADGRGTVGGPHVVAVLGFDGINPTEDSPLGGRLFPEYQLEHELLERHTTLDLVVPGPPR